MPLVHFDRQTVHEFFNISPEEAEQVIKEIDYKDRSCHLRFVR